VNKRVDEAAIGLRRRTLIGERVPRTGTDRLLQGRGRYVSDISAPRMLHLCFVRSPHAHARIVSIDAAAALKCEGVRHVFTGPQIAAICQPLVGVHRGRAGHKSAPQYPLAVGRVVWQGQPVVVVLAESRAQAEDGAEKIEIDWQPLDAVVTAEQAVAQGAGPIHPELGDNLAFEHRIKSGDPDKAFADAAVVVSHTFRFERQTGVPLEPRGLIADFNPADGTLTVHHSHQSPHQMQAVFSRQLGLPEHRVRVIAPDVGGGFGVKINVYAEELAVAAASLLIGRPVQYSADRLESFLSDAHAREHTIDARMAVSADGRVCAMSLDDLAAVGAYGMPLRFNIAEGMMAITMAGAPYEFANYAARTRSVYVNKNLIGMFRGVGMPLACVVTEVLLDQAAGRLGVDPVAIRRTNYRSSNNLPCIAPGGARLDNISLHRCLDKLVENMQYEKLRAEQAALRKKGVYRGIGIATFIEQTAYGPSYYGPSDAPVSVQDGCTLRMEPSGAVLCSTSTTDQGQGTLTGLAQIVASVLATDIGNVTMLSGDSAQSPYGGGAWASRGMAVGGEAALKAANTLKANVLRIAAAITKVSEKDLNLAEGQVVDTRSGLPVMPIAEVARIGYFRQDTLPKDCNVQLSVSVSHVDNHATYYTANGIQASWLELDPQTGFIRLLGHWAVDDCGRIVNPLIVEEQIRGGIVQGIGAALYEECLYGEDGSLLNGSLADYLVPMAAEMPDIHVDHIETWESATELGAKGIGEAGTIGAIGALWVAINDALKPFGTVAMHQPFTPERILRSLRND
jgi:aerobic carbon-monoxide dehydrogenase large subunit